MQDSSNDVRKSRPVKVLQGGTKRMHPHAALALSQPPPPRPNCSRETLNRQSCMKFSPIKTPRRKSSKGIMRCQDVVTGDDSRSWNIGSGEGFEKSSTFCKT